MSFIFCKYTIKISPNIIYSYLNLILCRNFNILIIFIMKNTYFIYHNVGILNIINNTFFFIYYIFLYTINYN